MFSNSRNILILFSAGLIFLLVGCGESRTINHIDATAEARIPTPTPQIVIREVEKEAVKEVEVVKEIDVEKIVEAIKEVPQEIVTFGNLTELQMMTCAESGGLPKPNPGMDDEERVDWLVNCVNYLNTTLGFTTPIPTQTPVHTPESESSEEMPETEDVCAEIPDVEQRTLCQTAVAMGFDMEDLMGMWESMDMTDMEVMGEVNPCDEVAEEWKLRCEESFALGIREDRIEENRIEENTGGESEENLVQTGYYIDGEFDPDNLPKIAKFNFSELDKLIRMSKLRSVVGHDFSINSAEFDPTGASCRSMKHYMIPVGVPRENEAYARTPHTFKWMSIKFFSPVDGVIQDVEYTDNSYRGKGYGLEAQFYISSNEHAGYYFAFFHVALDPSLVLGSEVKAGQYIGTLGSEENWVEIAVEVRINSVETEWVSFLQVATDEVLDQYKARGLNSVSDVIITKEERDANPIACDRNSDAGWFEGSSRYKENVDFSAWVFESTDNWFFFD